MMGKLRGGRVYWKDAPENLPKSIREVLTDDPEHFRECNETLRFIYRYFIDSIVENLGGDISDLSFAEVGCNTGYFLHALALRGAAKCVGLDYTPNAEVFKWFNRVLNTNSEFRFAEWNPLEHRLLYGKMPEVDVALTIAVMCHLADPLYHLAFLCDHSAKGIFIYTPVNKDKGLTVSYGNPAKYPNALSWPLGFDNEVRPSVPLLRMGLKEAGFDDIREVKCPDSLSPRWRRWYSEQIGLIGLRTRDVKTALGGGRRIRGMPSNLGSDEKQRILIEEGYRGYNIIGFADNLYGLAQSEGRLDLDKVGTEGYRCVVGKSVEEVKQLIGRRSK